VLLWQKRTIAGFYAELRKRLPIGVSAEDHVALNSLRVWGMLNNGKVVTEQVYVHSKVMIVDDLQVICGSANINDRSMLGDRDSEIALLIEDTGFEEKTFNGRPFQVSQFAHSLRMELWAEHLGEARGGQLLFSDPVSSDTFSFWKARSKQNTAIFEANFPGIPSDKHNTLAAMHRARNIPIMSAGPVPQVSQIIGHLVDHPAKFLEEEPEMELTGAASMVGVDVLV
jgi:phospholipase D1/2